MCWYFTLKGAAFFGASIHVCSGLIQMGRFMDTVMFLATNPKNTQTLESILVTIANLMCSGLRLPLSSLIFIGIEKESIGLLTWPPIAHFLLQVSGFMMRVKYGSMRMTFAKDKLVDMGLVGGPTTGQIEWVKEEFHLPKNLEELIEDTLFSFLFTSCHLLVLFFFVQKIETSFGGQVLDQSPGYSVTFFPHPIQPPPTPSSRLRLLSPAGMVMRIASHRQPHRNNQIQNQPIHSESFRNLNYVFPAHSSNLPSSSVTSINNQSHNQAPPPYQYSYEYQDGFSLIPQPTLNQNQSQQQSQSHQSRPGLRPYPSTSSDMSSPTIFPSTAHIKSVQSPGMTHQFASSSMSNNTMIEHNSTADPDNDQELRTPLLQLCHSTSSSTASLMGNEANNQENRITIISPVVSTSTSTPLQKQ